MFGNKVKLAEQLIKHWDELRELPIQYKKADFAELMAERLMGDGVTVQQWHPACEKPGVRSAFFLDEDGTRGSVLESDWVWGYTADGETYKVRYEEGPVFAGWVDGCGREQKVTHWMPLPAPPEGEGYEPRCNTLCRLQEKQMP